jgi:hypothetical protein
LHALHDRAHEAHLLAGPSDGLAVLVGPIGLDPLEFLEFVPLAMGADGAMADRALRAAGVVEFGRNSGCHAGMPYLFEYEFLKQELIPINDAVPRRPSSAVDE